MTSRVCVRCGHWWSFNTGKQDFTVITRFYPTCVAILLPVVDVVPMPKRVSA